jgi:hypothetical protein
MKRLVVVGALGVLVLVLIAWLALRKLGAGDATSAAAENVVIASAPQEREEPDVPDLAAERAVPSVDSPEMVPARVAVTEPQEQPSLAELRGRMLDADGAPLAGVTLELRGAAGNQELVQKYGEPKDWADRETQSDAEGHFRFVFDPPLAFQFFMDARAPGFARVSWRFFQLPPAQVTDVGDVRMPRSGSIRGRVVDERGAPVTGPWNVHAWSAWKPEGAGADMSSARTRTEAERAEFLLEGLPPGPASLRAHSNMTNWIDGPVVEVKPGEELVADIVYRGPDNSRRITVTTFNRPFHVFSNPEPGTLKLLGADGTTRVAERVAGSSQSWSFEDLPPGTYTAQIDDPRFLPWSEAGLSPGQTAKAQLVGASAIALTVLGEDGAPVEPYRMRLRYRNVTFQPDTFELRRAEAAAPAHGTYSALVPGECSVIVEAAGYASGSVDVDALAAGETRAVEMRLSRGSTVSGTVLDGSAAVANALVELVPFVPEPAQLDGTTFQNYFQARRAAANDAREARADAAGRFEFSGVPAGRYVLMSRVNSGLIAKLGPIECPGATENLELRLPSSGTLSGRLIGPEGASFEGLQVKLQLRVTDADPWASHFRSFDGLRGDLPSELNTTTGEFRVGPVAAGTYAVSLSSGKFEIPHGFDGSSTFEGPSVPLGEVELTSGTVERDFDVRAEFPGWLELDITLDGLPGAGLVVVPSSELVKGRLGSNQIAAKLDERGSARCGPAFPGQWSVYVRPIDGSWSWTAPASVTLAPGTRLRLRYDIQLVRGALRVLDPTSGEPLRDHAVFLVSGNGNLMRKSTGPTGELELAIPAGSFGLLDAPADGDWPFDTRAAVPFEWPAPQGQAQELRLPPAPKGG